MSEKVTAARRDRSMDPARGNLLSIPILVALAALALVPHWWLWGENPLTAGLMNTNVGTFLLILTVGIVLHEAIHGLTWVIAGGLKLGQLKFGILWHVLTPYAHPTVPIRVRAYQIGALMPGLVLGFLPTLAGLASGHATLTAWGALFLSVAAGDLLVLIKLGRVPANALVQDHPTRFGCEILEPDELNLP